MVTFRFLYHTMFLVCVFNVSIRIRTGAVCSFNSFRILPLMLSGPHVLCVFILCRSFCTPGRDIGNVVLRVWVLVQSGMLSYGFTVNTDWHCLLRMLDFCFVSAVICPSLIIGVTHVLSVCKDFIYDNSFLGLNWLLMFGQGNLKVCSASFFDI